MKARKAVKPTAGSRRGMAIAVTAITLPLLASFYYSGIKGPLLLSLGFYAAYKVSRHLLREVFVEKFVAIVFGVYFALAAAAGLLFKAAGVDMSPMNFAVAFGVLSVVMSRIGADNARVVFEWKRAFTIAVIFVACAAFYLYPTYPAFGSACLGGFDCKKHALYAESIHDEFKPIAPIVEWSHYPYGAHVNTALMAHAFSGSMNQDDNLQAMRDFMYRFMVIVTAATIAVTCGLILDSGAHWLYALLAAIFMLMGVYPASALMGHGFWAQTFGMFFVLLFGWTMPEYFRRPSAGVVVLLGIISVGSFLSYSVVTTIPVLMAFLLMLLFREKNLSSRIKHAALFIAILGLFAAVDFLDNYRVFLNYEGDIFGGKAITYDELNFTSYEHHTVNSGSLQSFILVGKKQMIAGGSAVFVNVKRFGLLAVFLAVFGLLCNARKQDHAAVFFEALVLFTLVFYVLNSRNMVSEYYYSKIAYLLFYPLSAFAFIGLREVVKRTGLFEKPWSLRYLAVVLIVLLCAISLLYEVKMTEDLYQTVFGQSLTTIVWRMVTLEDKGFGQYILQIC
jgi:hypothetical protein